MGGGHRAINIQEEKGKNKIKVNACRFSMLLLKGNCFCCLSQVYFSIKPKLMMKAHVVL